MSTPEPTDISGHICRLTVGVSLAVISGKTTVFESCGKWLYPLFELEEFLLKSDMKTGNLHLHDKIAGRAAAALISRMGFKKCTIDIVSEPALEVFEKYGVDCAYGTLVERIICKTEELITSRMDLDEVYSLLKKRAGLIHGIGLVIKGLNAGFPGNQVLKDFNLSMEPGERLVLTGDNGAGKTTLLKTLIGVLPPSSGEIKIDNPEDRLNRGRSSLIGYVNQSIQDSRFPITVSEIVETGRIGKPGKSEEQKYEVEIAMRRTGCFRLRDRNFLTLSGGERQRVSLARCLCQEAGLILLDEPTSFLDSDSKDDFLDVLSHVVKNQLPTVLLVSHDHEWIARLGWPIRELKKGKLC